MSRPSTKRNVITLIRVSTDGQALKGRGGIDAQRALCQLWIDEHHLTSVREIQITGLSGADVQHSARFAEMLEYLNRPDIDGVVISAIDRYFRIETAESFLVLQPLQNTKKHVFSDKGEIDPCNPEHLARLVEDGIQGGRDRRKILIRTVQAKEALRKRADSYIDPIPAGVIYDKQSGLYHYNESETPRIKEAIRRTLAGDNYSSIARDLGYKSYSALKSVLGSYWWIGIKAVTHQRIKGGWDPISDKRKAGKRIKRDKPILTETNLVETPLISREEWDRLQSILAQPRKHFQQEKSRVNNFLASGLLFCECGQKLYHKIGRNDKPSTYRCASYFNDNLKVNGKRGCGRGSYSAATVDRDVWTYFLTATRSKEAFIAANKPNETDDAANEKMRNQLQAAIAKQNKRLSNVIDMILDEGKTPILLSKRQQIEAEISSLSERLNAIPPPKHNIEDHAKEVVSLVKASKKMTLLDRKELLTKVVSSIRVIADGEDIAYYFNFK